MEHRWLEFYDEGVPHTLEYPSITVPEYLNQAAQRFPSQVATVFLGARLTYSQLKAQVDQLASQLQAMGVGKGDRGGTTSITQPVRTNKVNRTSNCRIISVAPDSRQFGFWRWLGYR